MASITANGIEIEYEEFGPSSGPVILLIMGLAAQLIAWPESFCETLAGRGFRVIRHDNRDTGLSRKFDGQQAPGPAKIWLWQRLGLQLTVPYTLSDMARDSIGLLDALNIGQAHVVGASMGGVIAQIAASEFPQRVTSLTSIMSTSGNPNLPGPDLAVLRQLMPPSTTDREKIINHRMAFWRMVGSPAWPPTDEELRARVVAGMDRAWYPPGVRRQMAAIAANDSHHGRLKRIKAPTLVIHGRSDRLIPPAAGEDTATRISGAQLEIIEGMGHDLPPELLPRLAGLIADHAER